MILYSITYLLLLLENLNVKKKLYSLKLVIRYLFSLFFFNPVKIQELLGLVWQEQKIVEVIERFNLDVALKSFMSNSLEKRLRGIKFIKNMVARLKFFRILYFLFSLRTQIKEEK